MSRAYNPQQAEGGVGDIWSASAADLPSQEYVTRNGKTVLTGDAPFLMNWLKEGQAYGVDVYFSHLYPNQFFRSLSPKQRAPIETETPVWSLRDLVYSLDHEASNTQSIELELGLDWIKERVVDRN